MSFFKKFANIAAFGCLGFCVAGLVGCFDDGPTSSNKNDDPTPVDPNTGKPMDEKIDSIAYVDPNTGEVIIRLDTTYVPADTNIVWVGNSALLITEIAPVNLDWLDEEGSDPGWVEIYNAGASEANLKGYTLVENLENARKWFFGDVKIPAKGFITVFCDKKNLKEVVGKDSLDRHFRTHTNWKLEKNGGTLYLIDPYYGIRDSVAYPELGPGISWGITDGGVWKYFGKPTPEQPNTKSEAYEGIAPEFNFNGAAGGFYNGEIKLNAPTSTGGFSIRCTQDGSVPTKNSPEFNQTITISQNTVLRCAAFKDGLLTNKVVTNTYFIDEQVSMPVVSVSVDPSFFTKHYIQPEAGHTNGDKPSAAPSGLYEDVEYPVHVEFFEKGSSSTEKSFEIEAGISLMGNYSRLERKKSAAIVIREEYQSGWLHYPLFKTREGVNDKYKGFNLRNNGNRFVSDYFADALGGALLEGSGVDYQRSRQVVVFYNGEYFGIHDMRERFNKNYVETNYDIDASTVTMIKHLAQEVTASNGTADDYLDLLEFVAKNDFSGENNENYAVAATRMDMGNFADYMVTEMYIHNGDWPNNNVRAWRTPDRPWKFMIYDLDHGFDWDWAVGTFFPSTNMFDWVKQGGRAEGSNKCYNKANELCFHTLYVKLIKNPDFKRLFINHASVILENYVNAENVEKVRSWMAESIDATEAERDLKHNGQKDRGYGRFSVSNSSLTTWAEERDGEFASQLKSEFGLSGQVSVTIGAEGDGSVLMEGMKLPGSGSSYKGKFFAGNLIKLEAVAGNGAIFAGWSDGVNDKIRLVEASDGASYTAKFKK